MKIIPTFVHGVTDYLAGFLLLLLPSLLGFADEGGAAVWVPRVIGLALLVQALATNYELGATRLLQMRMHLRNDDVAGVLLAASPWIFGFAGAGTNAWMPHVVLGVMIFVMSVMTERHPRVADEPVRLSATRS